MLIRTRLLWFSLGFASASAAIAQFVIKDLWIERDSLSSSLNERFSSLDTRVSKLESLVTADSSSSTEEVSIG